MRQLIKDSISGDIYVTDGEYLSSSLHHSEVTDGLDLYDVELDNERGEGWDESRYVTLREQ